MSNDAAAKLLSAHRPCDRVGQRAEFACASLCFAVVLPFAAFVLFEGSVHPLEYLKLSAAFVAAAALILGGAIIVYAGLELVRSGRGSGWQASPTGALKHAFASRWAEDRLLTLAWPLALFLVLLPSFNAFKQRILPQAGFVYDPELAALDRALFGMDPGLWLHDFIGSPTTTRFFDGVYHGWFVPTTLGLCVVGLCAGTQTRGQYMLSYAAVWILLGALLAYFFPAAGPAFYGQLVSSEGAAPFILIHQQLALAGETRFLTSLGNQAYLLENLASPVLVVGGGISAIPSIHNAMAVLFALASFRIHWLLGIAMSLFALLIWIASVYLNWHYAVDGLAGGLGAIIIWYTSGWAIDRLLGGKPVGMAPTTNPLTV